MGAPANRMRALEQAAGATLAVHPSRCAVRRNRNAGCTRCADVCPSHALSWDDAGLVVDRERCVGCGSCTVACPTGALEAVGPGDAELAELLARKAAEQGGRVAVACEACRAADERGGEDLVEVACLGRLGAELVAELAARGTGLVVLACARCADCARGRGGALARRSVAGACELLEHCGSQTRVELVEGAEAARGLLAEGSGAKGAPLPGRPVVRAHGLLERDGGGAAGQAGTGQADNAVPADEPRLVKGPDGHLPQQVPAKRVRLVNSVRALGGAAAEGSWDGCGVSHLKVTAERCRSCRGCAVFCPTGALATWDDEHSGKRGLAHRSALCTGCGLCAASCPAGALAVEPGAPVRDVARGTRVLIELPTPDWEPNKPDSMFRKWSKVLGGCNMAEY